MDRSEFPKKYLPDAPETIETSTDASAELPEGKDRIKAHILNIRTKASGRPIGTLLAEVIARLLEERDS